MQSQPDNASGHPDHQARIDGTNRTGCHHGASPAQAHTAAAANDAERTSHAEYAVTSHAGHTNASHAGHATSSHTAHTNATLPPFARLSDAQLQQLAQACKQPRQLALILDFFAGYSTAPVSTLSGHTACTLAQETCDRQTGSAAAQQSATADAPDSPDAQQARAPATPPPIPPFSLLAEYVDASPHDLREWVSALTLFADWLHAQGRQPQPLLSLLSYLSCCVEAQGSSPMPLTLPHLLENMLEQYGYEGGE